MIELEEVLCARCAESIAKCECLDGFWLGDPPNDCDTSLFWFACAVAVIIAIYFIVFYWLLVRMFGG